VEDGEVVQRVVDLQRTTKNAMRLLTEIVNRYKKKISREQPPPPPPLDNTIYIVLGVAIVVAFLVAMLSAVRR
jgi:hypothetical protein